MPRRRMTLMLRLGAKHSRFVTGNILGVIAKLVAVLLAPALSLIQGVVEAAICISVMTMMKTKERSRTSSPVLVAFVSLLAIVHPPLSPRALHHGTASDSGVYSVRAFGATGNGKTLDTPAINKAIDSAAAAGGGTVYFPAGDYLSVSIHLKSNIALYLDHGATIIAASPSNNIKYDPPEPNDWDKYQDFGHSHWHNSLIWGENLTNVSILGPGMIWGRGLVRSGSQSRNKPQNDSLNKARASGPKMPFDYPNPRDAVEPGWGNKS